MLLVFIFPLFFALGSLTALSGLPVLFFLLLIVFLTARATLTVFIVLILRSGLSALFLLGLG
jgi:hypothetical protein